MIFFKDNIFDPLSSFADMYSSKPTQTSGNTIQGRFKASLSVNEKDNMPLPDNFRVVYQVLVNSFLKIFFVAKNDLIN